MSPSSLLSLSLCFLVLFNGCFARRERQPDQRPLGRISALEPARRIHSEAGVTELWDENDKQFRFAGVSATRHIIRERGLLLPRYFNGPTLIYVLQGNGVQGAVIPGCPETYQSSESQSQYGQDRRQSRGDEHQKVRQIREGDVLALPAGIVHWVYNNGRSPLVLVEIIDTNNPANQLDPKPRVFFVAGNEQGGRAQFRRGDRNLTAFGHQQTQRNVFSGIDERLLAEAFNINVDLARRLRSEEDNRGNIVNVEGELDLLSPQGSREEEVVGETYREAERGVYRDFGENGIEETYCTAKLKHNINVPSHADVYNPNGGRVTNVNSLIFPILRLLQLSVQKGVLYRNAITAPYWNVNAHSIYYFTRGSGHVQIVDENGNAIFDGQVQEGKILTAPQNFVVIKKASSQGLEWVAFKTNDQAQVNELAGRVSALRALPVEVVANSFQVSIEDARRLKENRQEISLFSPWSRSSSY